MTYFSHSSFSACAASMLAVGLAFTAAQPVYAEVEKPWMIKAKVSRLLMSNQSEPIPALGVPRDAIHVSDETIPELDITYFWTSNWATEVVLTVPQKHDVTLENNGSTLLGTFKHLPPTVSMQYHFSTQSAWKPYVGLGVNYTQISDERITAGGLNLALESDSVGLAVGVGVDYELDNGLYLNFDIKQIKLRSDVYRTDTGAKVSEVKLDPTLVGFGVGWRF